MAFMVDEVMKQSSLNYSQKLNDLVMKMLLFTDGFSCLLAQTLMCSSIKPVMFEQNSLVNSS